MKRLSILLFLLSALFASNSFAGFSLDSVKKEYTAATVPAAQTILGNWVLTGMATGQQQVMYDPNGIKQNNAYAWTLAFSNPTTLYVVSNFVGTVPQGQNVKVLPDSIGFHHGFDTDLAFDFVCRTTPAHSLVCLQSPDQLMGLEFILK